MKKIINASLPISVILPPRPGRFVYFCPHLADTINMTGIITIFDRELEALKDYSLVEDIKKFAGRKYFIGKLNEQEIVFAQADNRPLDLALTTQIMINKFPIKRIFFTGQAIILAPYIEKGDIVIANYFIRPSEKENTSNQMFEADQILLQTLRTVCDIPRSDRPPHLFGTLLRWSEKEIDHPRLRMLQQEFGAIAIDNSGTALAYTCGINNIPFAAIDIAMAIADDGGPISEERLNRACQETFELKGLALVELTVSAITAHI